MTILVSSLILKQVEEHEKVSKLTQSKSSLAPRVGQGQASSKQKPIPAIIN